MAKGRREEDLDAVTSVFRPHTGDIGDFIFALRFEEVAAFSKQPSLKLQDAGGNLAFWGGHFQEQRSALYTNFVARINPLNLPAGAVQAEWRPA